ncbi:hypothetical protein D3P96_06535 [Weissella viridescens]|uniref:Uncharacterized protein n=1 Tax=Weissella viridescens TaxID=1629 RepID=A0A3P2RDZ4_WEIVI|nr:hypothetical protein [Weissella viridescens]RRG17605.1 hypothetical protein D3P96_06535 [Weissella viridescens]
MSEFMIGSSVQVQDSAKLETPALVMGYDPTNEQYLVRFEGGEQAHYPGNQLKNWCTCEI